MPSVVLTLFWANTVENFAHDSGQPYLYIAASSLVSFVGEIRLISF